MRLLSKTSLLIITASIFIFWVGNIAFFYITKEMISNQINSELMTQMSGVLTRLNNNDADFEVLNTIDEISIKELDANTLRRPTLRDTVLYNPSQQKFVAHRALSFNYKSASDNREITIYKSLLSSDKLIERITLSSIILLISFIIMIYILNRYIFSNVWSNFSGSLDKIDEYDFNNPDSLSLPGSEIEEFDKLNSVLLEMAERIQSDYRSLKELTANTSHEIQTPLAIIKSKAELLLQSGNLNKEEMETVSSILNTTGRLSKLNQSLLLIARIENNQFEESETLDLKSELEKYIENLDVLINAGGFKIVSSLGNCSVNMNHVLLDVLMSNLLKNAISHGSPGSDIEVSLEGCVVTVFNHGEPLGFPVDQLFKRFIQGSAKQESTGIGLEIVRKICNYYRIKVDYYYKENRHSFSVDFSKIEARQDLYKK